MTQADFSLLLEETRTAFEQSDIKDKAPSSISWNYSVCATAITPGKPLIIGFNWGATKNKSYAPQSTLPTKDFIETDNSSLGSLSRVKSDLKTYCKSSLEGAGQVNFCFFRSKHAYQISSKDIDLSLPLFRKLVEIAEPEMILGFSAHLREYFLSTGYLQNVEAKTIRYIKGSKESSCYVTKGTIRVKGKVTPVFLLPHPNSKLPKLTRHAAWDFCFEE